MSTVPPPLVAIVGPTATGKSGLGLALAAELDGEVVNADAMALYRGMDVGTAKPTAAQRAEVPHHLIDVLDVTETASVAAYQRAARGAVEGLRAEGRTPVLVGGSGLYVNAVLDELDFPGTDADLRAALEAELAERGPAALHARLAEVDPAAAEVVLPTNGRRIVRALEVVALTGRPFPARLPAGHGGPLRRGAARGRPPGAPTSTSGWRGGSPRCSPAASSPRPARSRGAGCARAARRRARSATSRCWPRSTARATSRPRRPTPSARRGGSSAGNGRGSAGTAASPGSTAPRPTCPDAPLAALRDRGLAHP